MAEVFLGRCLGGRYEEITDEIEGSSAQVPVGAEHLPGLAEALARRDDPERMATSLPGSD